jgi:hypothetical protein
MKIVFNEKLYQNAEFLIRRCGYGLVRDYRATEVSYSRRLGGGIYPRFHLYINSVNPLILNLHLDQKQASYGGQTAHSGDYDSEVVSSEGQRIYAQIIKEGAAPQVAATAENLEDNKKGVFSWLFGKK